MTSSQGIQGKKKRKENTISPHSSYIYIVENNIRGKTIQPMKGKRQRMKKTLQAKMPDNSVIYARMLKLITSLMKEGTSQDLDLQKQGATWSNECSLVAMPILTRGKRLWNCRSSAWVHSSSSPRKILRASFRDPLVGIWHTFGDSFHHQLVAYDNKCRFKANVRNIVMSTCMCKIICILQNRQNDRGHRPAMNKLRLKLLTPFNAH